MGAMAQFRALLPEVKADRFRASVSGVDGFMGVCWFLSGSGFGLGICFVFEVGLMLLRLRPKNHR